MEQIEKNWSELTAYLSISISRQLKEPFFLIVKYDLSMYVVSISCACSRAHTSRIDLYLIVTYLLLTKHPLTMIHSFPYCRMLKWVCVRFACNTFAKHILSTILEIKSFNLLNKDCAHFTYFFHWRGKKFDEENPFALLVSRHHQFLFLLFLLLLSLFLFLFFVFVIHFDEKNDSFSRFCSLVINP